MCFYTNTHNTNSNPRWQVLRVCGVKSNGLDSFDMEAKWHFTIELSQDQIVELVIWWNLNQTCEKKTIEHEFMFFR